MALPDSPDSYFQEIGRAGRDGEPSRTLLLWRVEDEAIQRFFNGGAPDTVELRELAAALRAGPATKTALKDRTGLGPRKIGQLLEPPRTGERRDHRRRQQTHRCRCSPRCPPRLPMPPWPSSNAASSCSGPGPT